MRTLFKIAWRNIWRNKRRTLITVASIMFALFFALIMRGFGKGSYAKMKQNAIAIGKAAAHGDLSENSEYKFALEERDLLQARLAQMNAEMAIVRVISENDVPTDHVGIGTHVVMKHLDDDSRYEVTIVGPWEADVEEGLINYQTPLARSMLGKRIGDIVEFDYRAAKGRYEVVELSAHLAQPPSES